MLGKLSWGRVQSLPCGIKFGRQPAAGLLLHTMVPLSAPPPLPQPSPAHNVLFAASDLEESAPRTLTSHAVFLLLQTMIRSYCSYC